MFKEERKTLQFEWSHLGDIDWGRPNLGPQTTVAIYRLMQFTLRDACIKNVGVETTNRIIYEGGVNAGMAVYRHMLESPADFNTFASQLQRAMRDLSIGIVRVESSDLDNYSFELTVAEDLDCSGLPVSDEAVCTFDEGFFAGLFSAHFGKKFVARETDCWCTGDRVCRFAVTLAEIQ
ncbi:MAG: V4R domain-containing protein [Thermodesulfobacteriota bacterium]